MNQTSKNLVIAGIVVVLLILGISVGSKTSAPSVNQAPEVGATAGPDNYTPYNFYNGLYGKFFSQGGAIKSFVATSTQSAYTVTQADLTNYNVFQVTATNSPALTLTLPATSTLTSLIKTPGDIREWVIYNNHTGAATTTTVVTGTGITLGNASTSAVIVNGKSAMLRLQRRTNGDVTGFLTQFSY